MTSRASPDDMDSGQEVLHMVITILPYKEPETLGNSASQLIKGIFILFSVLKALPPLSLLVKGLKT